MTQPWYNTERVSQPGSVILNRWMRERQSAKVSASTTHPISTGVYGSELYEWLCGGSASTAGVAVTERTAMAISSVYSCVGLIAGSIASMPLPVYQRNGDARQRIDHDLWWLLNEEPCPAYSASVFWECMLFSLLIHGDGFAKILRPSPLSPKIIGFEPYHRNEVEPFKNGKRLGYVLTRDGKTETLDQDDMIHIPGLGFNGLTGMSPLRYCAKQMMGIALAADEYSARFFSNGARPDYVVTMPGGMKPDQADIFRKSWTDRYAGVSNAHVPAILTGGGDVKSLSLKPEDAQLIETRAFQATDIARFYGVPPHMIGITDKATSFGSGIEQMSIGFVKYTLQRHLVKIEQEFNRKCFRIARNFVEFSTSGLERGDYKARNEGYRIALGRAGEPAWLTVNEVRKYDNLPPIEGGDKLNSGNDPAVSDPAPATA